MGSMADRFRIPAGAAALALLGALLGGCSAHAPAAQGSGLATADAPLQVWLPGHDLHVGPWAVFHVNKPAYVAMFEIIPGVGVRAIYPHDPGAGGQRRFHAGIQTVLAGRGPGSGFVSSSPGLAPFSGCTGSLRSPVVWRLVVASERPLDLRRLRPFVGFRYRPAIGGGHFAGGSVYRTMDDILHAVLPPGAAPDPGAGLSEWAVDYVPYWTSPRPCVRAVHLAAVSFKTPIRARTKFGNEEESPAENGDGEGRDEAGEVDLEDLEERIAETVANLPGGGDPEGTAHTAKPRLRDAGERGTAAPGPGEATGAATPDTPLRAWTPERRAIGRALDAQAGGHAAEGRQVERRTFLPPRTNPGGFDDAVGRNRGDLTDRAPTRLRYLPNARVPDRAFRPDRPLAGPRSGVRGPRPSARPAPQVRQRPAVKPAPRPRPAAKPAPRPKAKDRDAQR